MKKYWSLAEFLKLIDTLKEYPNFIFFSNEKSQALEFFKWANKYTNNAFGNLKIIKKTHSKIVKNQKSINDYLLHNFDFVQIGEAI